MCVETLQIRLENYRNPGGAHIKGILTNLDHFTHLITNLDHFSYPTHTIYNTVTLLVNTERIIKLGSSRFSLDTSLQKWIKLITNVDHGMTP